MSNARVLFLLLVVTLLLPFATAAQTVAPPTTSSVPSSTTPSFQRLGAFIPSPGRVVFEWMADPTLNISTYRLLVSSNRDFTTPILDVNIASPPDARVFASTSKDGTYKIIQFGPDRLAEYIPSQSPFRASVTYYWKVTGNSNSSQEIQSTPTKLDQATKFTPQQLGLTGFTLQRDFIEKNVTQTPVFSLGKPQTSGGAPTYNADVALVWRPEGVDKNIFDPVGNYPDSIGPFAAAEAHVSSDPSPKASEHSIGAEFGIWDYRHLTNTNTPLAQGLELYSTAAAQYQSSQNGETQKLVLSVQTVPVFFPWFMDQERAVIPSDDGQLQHAPISYQHELTFGFDAGGTTRGSATGLEDSTSVFRLMFEFHPQLNIHGPNGNLIPGLLKSISVYGDDTARYLATVNRGVNYLTSGVDFHITDNLAVSFYYKVGRTTPDFQKVESVNFGLSGSM